MIYYLEGEIKYATASLIVVVANGVGYEVSYVNNIVASDFGKPISLYIYHQISEYGQSLYGFDTLEERLLFENIITIKGIGVKAIFNIFSELKIKSYTDLQSITLDELTKVGGVGKSIAQKFLLGLSGKLKKEFDLQALQANSNGKALETQFASEIKLLVEWGMEKKTVIEFISRNLEQIQQMETSKLIQYIIKNINL